MTDRCMAPSSAIIAAAWAIAARYGSYTEQQSVDVTPSEEAPNAAGNVL